jgi:hypothetical protein
MQQIEEATMKISHAIVYVMLVCVPPALSGCWYAAAAGAGAYGGYKAKEKGYKAQSPITKETPKKSDEEEDK